MYVVELFKLGKSLISSQQIPNEVRLSVHPNIKITLNGLMVQAFC